MVLLTQIMKNIYLFLKFTKVFQSGYLQQRWKFYTYVKNCRSIIRNLLSSFLKHVGLLQSFTSALVYSNILEHLFYFLVIAPIEKKWMGLRSGQHGAWWLPYWSAASDPWSVFYSIALFVTWFGKNQFAINVLEDRE